MAPTGLRPIFDGSSVALRAYPFMFHDYHCQPVQRRRDAFDHRDWIFELKYDGFRSLAKLQHGRCELGNPNGSERSRYGWISLRPTLNGRMFRLRLQALRPAFRAVRPLPGGILQRLPGVPCRRALQTELVGTG